MLAVVFMTRRSSIKRGAIITRYASMSHSPRKVLNACRQSDTFPPVVAVSTKVDSLSWFHVQVSVKARI
jgi:hypothetical protein